ncbi:MAG: hypothetical protein ONB14_10125 [candidate division KSB1 bacterium]|nr:hypothetical protein [candidate division KSB1 bacterium]
MGPLHWKSWAAGVLLAVGGLASQASTKETHASFLARRGEIGVAAGGCYHAVRDELLSQEKYTGGAWWYAISWRARNGMPRAGLCLDVATGVVSNYGVSAQVLTGTLRLAWVYPVRQWRPFGRRTQFLLGPSTGLVLYSRVQRIARGGASFFDAYSAAALVLVGPSLAFHSQLTDHLRMEARSEVSLLAVGGKLIDLRESKSSLVRPLAPWQALFTLSEVNLLCPLWGPVNARAGYRLSLLRLSAWDYLLLAADTIYLGIVVAL